MIPVGLIRGTTQFVADSVVEPTIKAKSYVAGVRQGVKALFGPRKTISRMFSVDERVNYLFYACGEEN